MSNSRRRPEPESQAEPQAAPGSNLAGWHEALEQVRTQNGECAEIQARMEGLEREQEKFSADRKVALEREDEDALTRSLARAEILAVRGERLAVELAEARGRAQTELDHFKEQCRQLWLSFRFWTIAREKARLLKEMVGGCDDLTIDRTVLHLATVDAVRKLEISASDVEGVLAQASKLFDACSTASEFASPAYKAFVPLGKGGRAEDVPGAPETLIGPYADLPGGLTQREIAEAWKRIREADPGITMAEAGRKLAEAHPEIFLTPAEAQQLQAPLGTSVTPERWLAPMIGDTRPAEEPQIPQDRVFATLNS